MAARMKNRIRLNFETLEGRDLMASSLIGSLAGDMAQAEDANATEQTVLPRTEATTSVQSKGSLTNQNDTNGTYSLNSTGTGVLANSFLPGTPNPISPSGSFTNATPTFHWTAVANASWYRLYVLNLSTNRVVLDTWVQNTTSHSLNTALTAGNYRFWVQAWGNGFTSNWSSPLNFSVKPPATSSLIGPSGSFTNATPTFHWTAAANASWYRLYVLNLSTNKVALDTWVQNATSFTPSSKLAAGNYRFWVQSWGGGLHGNWSTPMNFTVKPSVTTLTSPFGTTFNGTPTYRWDAATNASWYRLYVINETTNRVIIDTWVQNATSFTSFSRLAAGNYRFWVQGWGNGVLGDWSSSLTFRIV